MIEIDPPPFVDGIVYGEGPRWHDGRLWFTDGPAGKVYSAGEAGDLKVEAEVPHASGVGWLPDGTFFVSTFFDTTLYHVDRAGSAAATFDVSDLAPYGMGFLPDGSPLVLNELGAPRVLAFDWVEVMRGGDDDRTPVARDSERRPVRRQ